MAAPPRHPGAALAWAGWWLLLLGLWMALANKPTVAELAAGAGAAALGATAAVLVRRQRRALARPPAAALGGLAGRVAAIPRDLALLARVLVRPTDGSLVELPFPLRELDRREAARRVLASTAGSIAPNTVVVDLDESDGGLVAHRLAAHGDARREADPLELA